MALSKSSKGEIPKDAVVITEDEALRYQWEIIKDWKKESEVWALKHSATIGAVMSSLTGIFVNSHFRRKLRLGQHGQMSSYVPIVVIPAIFTVLTHKFFVQRDIILDPLRQCPVCLQVRSATFQTGFGIVYPLILAPIAGFMFATRNYTYNLPSLTEKPMEVLQLFRKITKPILPTLGAIFAGQALITFYLTYKEINQSANVFYAMQKMEQQIEEQLAEQKMLQNTF